MRLLYSGDCLSVMQELEAESIDLAYVDPPIAPDCTPVAERQERQTSHADALGMDPDSPWHWQACVREEFERLSAPGAAKFSQTLRNIGALLPDSDLLAGLTMLAPRLAEVSRLLKGTGSLYLHCTPASSHYLKILADNIFGAESFRAEISVGKKALAAVGSAYSNTYGASRSVLLFYAKGNTWTFNRPFAPYSENYIKKNFSHVDITGRRYRLEYLVASKKGDVKTFEFNGFTPAPGTSWKASREGLEELKQSGHLHFPSYGSAPLLKRYLDEMPGQPVGDDWHDLASKIPAKISETSGQKQQNMMERIIGVSSRPGDMVLDPFCGSGSTFLAAEKLGRQWIGIDISYRSLANTITNLHRCYPDVDCKKMGFPDSVMSARSLACGNGPYGPMQLGHWALHEVGAIPATGRKQTPPGDVAGTISFHATDEPSMGASKIRVFVISGSLPPNIVNEIASQIDSESPLALLISLDEPTRAMRMDALSKGFFEYPDGSRVPRVQIITVKSLLNGQRPKFLDFKSRDLTASALTAKKSTMPRQATLPVNG